MDVLNLWNDDPEEVLMDLGFGCDELDLSGRIPARFINHQSQARGINLQVFLEAQKNRLDLENPDVSYRFRQLEVLQQVTTAFSSLVGSSSPSYTRAQLLPEVQDRRRRVGMLFKRASKKSLSQINNQKNQNVATTPSSYSPSALSESSQSPLHPGDKKIPSKRSKPELLETGVLSPRVEEQGTCPDLQLQPHVMCQKGQDYPLPVTTLSWRKKRTRQINESFEIEEINSSDDRSVTGSCLAEHLAQGVTRTSSCQSDSSGFLEEPFILSLPQQPSPGPDLIKALSGLPIRSTDSQGSDKPSSPCSSPPHNSSSATLSSSLNYSDVEKLLPSSPCHSPEPSLVFVPTPSSCLPKDDLKNSEKEAPQKVTDSHSLTLPSSSLVISDLLTRGSEDTGPENKDTTLPHNSKSIPYTTFSSAPQAFPTYSFSPSVAMHITQSDLSSGSPGYSQSEWTEVALYLSGPSAFDYSLPCASLPHIKMESLENEQKDSVILDSEGVGLTPANTKTVQNKTPTSLSLSLFQLYKNNSSAPSPLFLDSYSSDNGCLTMPSLSVSPSVKVGQSAPQSHDSEGLMNPAAQRPLDMEEKSTSRQEQLCSHYDNTDPSLTSPSQDVICLAMNLLYMDRNYLQRHREADMHSYIAQTQDTNVSDTKSSAALSEDARFASQEICNQILVPSCGLHDGLPDFLDIPIRTEVELKNLTEIESLDQVFETSVDDSEGENVDVEAFFQQLDTEGQIYWAEPIQVSNPVQKFKESCCYKGTKGSPGYSLLSRGSTTLESVSSTNMSSLEKMSAEQNSQNSTDLKPLSRSVSVQLSSSLSSHIVHRKDVPYMTDSKCIRLPSVLPLDTSSTFHALQTWTDMQILRNNEKLSLGALHCFPNKVAVSMDDSETRQRPTLVFSSASPFPLLSTDRQSNEYLPGISRNYQTVSVSLDTGLCPDEEEEVDRNIHEDEDKLGEGNQTRAYFCSCDHRCNCCVQKSYNKQHTQGNMPYSLGDLEQMIMCLQQFRFVLSNMEEQLSEDQAEIYTALSEQDREKMQDIKELREAVKQEAAELEMQLNELAHYYDDSLKMKMDRLLDEQSVLCSQLRVPTLSSPTTNRTVATQCCLLPWVTTADVQSASSWNTWTANSPSQGCLPTKKGKLEKKGFHQKVRTLHHDLSENK